jgi:hypothetical protein
MNNTSMQVLFTLIQQPEFAETNYKCVKISYLRNDIYVDAKFDSLLFQYIRKQT